MIHGASDRDAAHAAENPTSPADLADCLGVDLRMLLHDRPGRPLTLCDGSPIQAILR